eukprot:scaffold1029_cov194-Amphora_coffeaeformis.AAC.12
MNKGSRTIQRHTSSIDELGTTATAACQTRCRVGAVASRQVAPRARPASSTARAAGVAKAVVHVCAAKLTAVTALPNNMPATGIHVRAEKRDTAVLATVGLAKIPHPAVATHTTAKLANKLTAKSRRKPSYRYSTRCRASVAAYKLLAVIQATVVQARSWRNKKVNKPAATTFSWMIQRRAATSKGRARLVVVVEDR